MDLNDTRDRYDYLRLVGLVFAFVLIALAAFSQDAQQTGSITANGQTVQLAITNRGGGVVQLTGSWTGTVQFEGTVDNTNWFSMPVSTIAASPVTVTSATANGRWSFAPAGYAAVRVRASAAITGSATIAMRAATASAGSSGGGGGGGGTVTQGASNGGSDPWSVTCASGCAGGTTDVDDDSIALGQTTGIQLPLNYVYNPYMGIWQRLHFGQSDVFGSLPVAIASDQWALTSSAGTVGGVTTYSLDLTGYGAASTVLSGTWSGTMVPQVSYDNGVTWTAATLSNGVKTMSVANGDSWTGTGSNGSYILLPVGAPTQFRWNATAWTSGTANVSINAGFVGAQPPMQTNSAGALKVDGSSVVQPISGTVSGSGNFTVVQPTGTNLHAVLDATSTTTVTQATGSNLHTVLDSGTLTSITNAVTVAQPTAANLNATVTGSGNFTVVQGTGTNLHTVVDSGTIAVTNAGLTNLDIALSALRDAIIGSGPKTLTDVVNAINATLSTSTFGAAFPTTGSAIGAIGATGTMQPVSLDPNGALRVATVVSGRQAFLPPCNALRRANCR